MALVDPAAALPSSGEADRTRQPATAVTLVLSVTEAAEVLGVSNDLIYELIARGGCGACRWAAGSSFHPLPSSSSSRPP